MDEIVSKNPSTGEVLWKGYSAKQSEVDEAVAKATAAFKLWASKSFDERMAILINFRDLMKESKETFAEIISKENGKPLWEAKNEVDTITSKVDNTIDSFKDRCKPLIKQQAAGLSVTYHKPHGVVAVFGPFNFPGHLPNGHIVPSLLIGNTIVFKPSELTSWVATEMVNIWKKAGLPEGVLNIVYGTGDVGKYLAGHPGIHGVFFTGSWKTGKLINEQLIHQPQKILALELGGNNPLILGQISNVEAAAYIAAQSAFITSGQRCTSARRMIVPKGEMGDLFLKSLTDITRNIQIGPYTSIPEPFMGPLISADSAKKIIDAQHALVKKGGILLLECKLKDHALVSPGLIDVTAINDRPDEEYFGPLFQIIRTQDFDASIKEANQTGYGLTAGILSDSKAEYERVLQEVRSGVISWNSPTTGAYGSAPFGGLGKSGNYRPGGYYAIDYCCYPVATVQNDKLSLPNTFLPGLQIK